MSKERIQKFAIAVEILLDYRKKFRSREDERAFRPTVLESGRALAAGLETRGFDAQKLRAFLCAVESPLIAENGPPVLERWAAIKADLNRIADSLTTTTKPNHGELLQEAVDRFIGAADRLFAQYEEVVRREAIPNLLPNPHQDMLDAALKRGLMTMRVGLLTAGKTLPAMMEKSGNDSSPLQTFIDAIDGERLPEAAALWPTLKAALQQIALA